MKPGADSPKGLYVEHDPEKPLAPCPLKVYRQGFFCVAADRSPDFRSITRTSSATGSTRNYQCWLYGHYMLSGTCFCDHCLGGFLDAKGIDRAVLAGKATGKQRHQWLNEQKLMEDYCDYLAGEMTTVATWCREELHRINPDLLFNMLVIEIGNWFCEGIARGLSLPDFPLVNFCEHTYYSVGYDRAGSTRRHQRYRRLRAARTYCRAAPFGTSISHRPARLLAAHAYNLAVHDEGWLYWPGDQLFRDYGSRFAYLNKPAYFEDYWALASGLTRRSPPLPPNRAGRVRWTPSRWCRGKAESRTACRRRRRR